MTPDRLLFCNIAGFYMCLLIDTIHAKLLSPVPNCQSLSPLHPVALFNRVTWCKGETLTY